MNDVFDVYVLRQMDYREHDVIVQVLSKEHGLLSLLVKGMKKQTSKLAYAFQLFSFTRVTIDYHDKDKLHIVKNASVIDSYRLFRENLECLAIMSVCSELTVKLEEFHGLFGWYQDFINHLRIHEQKLTVMNLYLAKLLQLEGNGFYVDGCVMCNRQKNIVTVSIEEGGFICKNCNQQLHLPIWDVDLLQAFRVIHKASFVDYDKMTMYCVNAYKLTCILLDALQYHSGITIVSRRFFQEYFHTD